ncbi:hypothetical protein D3C73_185270 [compost metagenome]
MNYKDYAKQQVNPIKTWIRTRIDDNRRISSCYRKFENIHFERWGWETFLWDGDHRQNEYNVLDSAEEVVNLHARVLAAHGE